MRIHRSGPERVMGIEPTQPAWKAGALPLSYTRVKSRARLIWVEQDSNLRRQCHQIYSLAPLAAWVSTRLGFSRRLARTSFSHDRATRRSTPVLLDRAGGETRTHNLRFTKPLLYRLSYASNQDREIPNHIVCKSDCKRVPRPIRRTPIGAISNRTAVPRKPARDDR